jgi:hypothetical protein
MSGTWRFYEFVSRDLDQVAQGTVALDFSWAGLRVPIFFAR